MTRLMKHIGLVGFWWVAVMTTSAQTALSPADLLAIKTAGAMQLTSDGSRLIYRISTPRTANEAPGSSHQSYWIMDLQTQNSQALFDQDSEASSPSLSPDGQSLAMIKKTDGIAQVWLRTQNGDEIQITHSPTKVNSYQWHPNSKAIAYIASGEKTEQHKELDKRGYNFIFYEEDIINDDLWLQAFDENFQSLQPRQLTRGLNIWNCQFDQQGQYIAYTASDKKLTDQNYMFRKIHIMDLSSAQDMQILNNEGKLGAYFFSPDGTKTGLCICL